MCVCVCMESFLDSHLFHLSMVSFLEFMESFKFLSIPLIFADFCFEGELRIIIDYCFYVLIWADCFIYELWVMVFYFLWLYWLYVILIVTDVSFCSLFFCYYWLLLEISFFYIRVYKTLNTIQHYRDSIWNLLLIRKTLLLMLLMWRLLLVLLINKRVLMLKMSLT